MKKLISLLLLLCLLLPMASSVLAAGIEEAGQWPIETDDYIVFTLMQDANVTDWEYGKNAFTTWLQDYTGVEIRFNFLPVRPDTRTDLNLKLLSNSYESLGDVIFAEPFTKSDQMLYGTTGVFAPLEELVDKYTVNIKKQFDTVEGARAMSRAPDGNIYALPYVGACYACLRDERAWANDLMWNNYQAATGAGMMETTEDLYNYLVWVRDNDANGNGDPNDEIPFLTARQEAVSNCTPINWLMNAFILRDRNSYYVDANDQIHAAFAEEGWRKGLIFLNKLYKEGLLDPSSFTNDRTAYESLMAQNEGDRVAFTIINTPHQIGITEEIRKKYDTNIPPIGGPDGVRNGFYKTFGMIDPQRTYVIPAVSQKKELTMRVLDALWTFEAWQRMRRGVPGEQWIVPDPALGLVDVKGQPAKFMELTTTVWATPSAQIWQNNLPGWAQVVSDDNAAKSQEEYDGEAIAFVAARASDDYITNCAVPELFFSEEVAAEASIWFVDLRTSWWNGYAQFITGEKDPNSDADWNAYVKELEGYGLQEYLAAMQEAFDPIWKGNYPHEFVKNTEYTTVQLYNDPAALEAAREQK